MDTDAAAGLARDLGTDEAPLRLDLTSPEIFFSRELTWLGFNDRVLHQARDERTPLLERVKFAAIAASNMDEFFMKRIGGIKQQIAAGVHTRSPDGRTPREQLEACYAFILGHHQDIQDTAAELLGLLPAQGIEVLSFSDLSPVEREAVRREYRRRIFPLVTPQSIDPAHPFPFISNLSLNLLVTLRYLGDTDVHTARVKVPVSADVPRFVRVGPGDRFVRLEDVMANNLDMLFPGMEVLSCELFRVIRNANTERNEEHADDLLALIESELRERRFAPVVRLAVLPGMPAEHRGRMAAELGLDPAADVFEEARLLAVRDLWEIARLDRPDLKDPAHHPVDHPDLAGSRNVFHVVREVGSILLHHPYESFTSSVERFLKEAASDPKVRAIKMTLYRTGLESPVVRHLIAAAENGKQVAVVVELKARFDEEANIRLAEMMEEAGIHVTYGVVGLKTHAKVILVVRQDFDGVKRYVHFGTGNYHPLTTRLYSDIGLLAYSRELGEDATELFNYLTTGFTPKRSYQKLLVAPKLLKSGLLARIDREVAASSPQAPGHIQFKVNALDDPDICRALYRASAAGVRVDLIVRDGCRIRPGVPGLSENIRVISIVGRFLEHARVYYFRNGGAEEYYIGSADAMLRSLEHRVEVLAPVEDPRLRSELRFLLDTQWADQRTAWDLRPDGSSVQRRPPEVGGGTAASAGSQEALIVHAEKRHRQATRLKKRKLRRPTEE